MIPYAASLLKRELTLPAVVPRPSAISVAVRPLGELRSIPIMRCWNSVFIIMLPVIVEPCEQQHGVNNSTDQRP
jgi:hypothetical protein